jgi:predicted dehydrogenase
MADAIRWGILGTGAIAKKFAEGLAVLKNAKLMAVGSRAKETAEAFGAKYSVPNRHASYEALANDPQVDAIYVATPHPAHKENSILCLRAGKAVLCEKPFAINARDAEEVIAVARQTKRFLMEAMWTRFLPTTTRIREILAANTIGDVRMMRADFGFRANPNPQSRLFSPMLGGGGLMDVGVYTVSYAHMVYRRSPTRIIGMADIGSTGVDEQCAVLLGYDKGELALLSSAVRTTTLHEAVIFGTNGWIRAHHPYWRGTRITVSGGGKEETYDLPYEGNGYNCEAAEMMRCLCEGKLESDIMPHAETLAVMKTLDAVRAQWGLKYPME